MRTLRCAAALLTLVLTQAHAQAAVPTHFDVITVKPAPPEDQRVSLQWNGAGMELRNMPLRVFIAFANNVQPWLVSGLPNWAETTRWDMSAKIVDAAPATMNALSIEQRRALMISALQERFGMVTHHEQKIQPVFVLSVAPGGTKFQPTPPLPPGTPLPPFGRTRWSLENGVLRGTAVSMQQFADQLAGRLDRNVIDQTGLSGDFDLRLKLPPRESSNPADDGGDADPPQTLPEAVREQLGLKVTSSKAPAPTLVVDKLTQPEAN